ncbi:unnamed protein product [Bursaphelenchus xylophilus]|uniref:Serine/threonine-protein phosphatase n=1 Tax=Bursaphelenchus xylophilus TaxID=6326 RepID=A0A1I7SLR3_BURXY|nr:unnamed protein product [Bursaphelenchus xylophilus]CAG9129709.1 unnamed protein product [Bursaphelenchus xylophilus]
MSSGPAKEASHLIPPSPTGNAGVTKRQNVVSTLIEPSPGTLAPGVASSIIRKKSGIGRNNLFTRDEAPKRKPSIKQSINNTEGSVRTITAVCDVTQDSKRLRQSSKTFARRKDGQKVTKGSTRKKNSAIQDPSITVDPTMKSSIESVKKLKTDEEEAKSEKSKALSKPIGATTSSCITEDKVIENFDIGAFLDRHYAKVQPGVHRLRYTPSEIRTICKRAIDLLSPESALIDIRAGLYVCGDIHGQFNDLINMFILLGRPPNTRYCFLGDYVDRGGMSLECIMMLLAYKVLYPKHMYLLRGNHECGRVNKKYGFMDELEQVFGLPYAKTCWEVFQRVFNVLPAGAVIEKKIICMHGGLSPLMYGLEEIKKESKPIRNPSKGIINDMLWADPQHDINFWRTSTRGSGFCFGNRVIDELLNVNKLEMILRAHQLCMDGFWFFNDRKLVTIFSAPVYGNTFKNASAALRIDKDLKCRMVTFVPDSPDVKAMVETRQTLYEAPPPDSEDPIAAPIPTPLPQSCT